MRLFGMQSIFRCGYKMFSVLFIFLIDFFCRISFCIKVYELEGKMKVQLLYVVQNMVIFFKYKYVNYVLVK